MLPLKSSGQLPAEHAAPRRASGLRRYDPGWLTAAVLFIVGSSAALSVDVVTVGFGIKGDEATYVSMALSAAMDGDLAYERRDLERFWRLYQRGPEGIFLKRGQRATLRADGQWPFVHLERRPDGREDRLYYGKAAAHAVVAAPFVRLAGLNGLFLLHAVLATLVFLAAYHFLAARASPGVAVPFALAFLGGSIAPLYLVWLTPEILNVALVFFAYFLWLYKEVAPPAAGPWARFLRGRGSDLAAAVLIGVATYSKPLNLPLVAPLVALRWWRREILEGVIVGAVCVLAVGASFGINALVSGEFNYQGGDRKTFYGRFPFEGQGATFDTRGIRVATDDLHEEILRERQAFWGRLRDNVVYFTVGRHAGLLPYYFPAVVVLGLALWRPRRLLAWQTLSLAMLALTAAVLLLWLPYTWAGGGGPPGNRYFLSLYPVFLFLAPPIESVRPALVAWLGGALFTAQILINPFVSSARPWVAPSQGLLRSLPVELTMVNDLPVMINTGRGRVPYGRDPQLLLYFLDDNAWLPESAGIWVAGGARTEIIVRTGEPLDRLDLTMRTLVPNTVTIRAGGEPRSVTIEPGAITSMSLSPTLSHTRNGVGFVLEVETATGGVPRLLTAGSGDHRYLGVLLQLTGRLAQPGAAP